MKKIYPIVILLFCHIGLFAQTDSITSRDDIQFGYIIKNNILPDLERVLNFIADKTTGPNETDEIIVNKTKGGKDVRLFTDNKIIVENDLKPGADTNKLLRADMNIVDYLNAFNTSYTKTEDKNISFTFISKSELKKTTYFFYNVLFECNYSGTNSDGDKFGAFNRVAEIKLVYDQGWRLYINSVYFPRGTEMDETNNFTNIIKMETDIDKILSAYDNEEQKRKRDEKNKLLNLIDEGDDKFEIGDYEGALKKYREARQVNFYNKEPQEKIKQTKIAIAMQNEKKQAKILRDNRIAELKASAIREQKNYNFKQAKILCDSLINDFNDQDTAIINLNEELSQINSALMGIETALEHGNLKEAVRNCENKIKEAKFKSNIYKAELYYRMAMVYFTLDKSERTKIMEALDQAINISGNKHQEALKLRVKMYLGTGEVKDRIAAVQDATMIISNDSRNPVFYAFRAEIYEKDNNSLKAIEDYNKAIVYKTQDQTVFLRKAMLEFNSAKYHEVIKTTDDAVPKTTCYGVLYFYRCLAKEKLKYYKEAGEDYENAINCGLSETDKKIVKDISSGHLKAGTNFFYQSQFKQAIVELTKSIYLDKNDTALYLRARSYLNIGNNDSAITDLSAVINSKPEFRDAHNQRGIALTNQGKFKEAMTEFDAELNRYKDNAPAFYSKGMALFKQKDYNEAVGTFFQSGTISYSDTAFYMASLSGYMIRNYTKAIEYSNMARKAGSKKFEIPYVCGRANYDINNFSEAIKEFEKAKKLVTFDDDLFFWHALALEANKDFIGASLAYDLLNTSKKYKDTAIFRSAVCLTNTRDINNYNQAIGKFVRYNVINENPDKSEANAWAAYAYLNTGELDKAMYNIEISKKSNEQCAMLQFVLACQAVKSINYEEALNHLEKAVSGLKWSKKDYDNEPLLKDLKKNKISKDRYAKIMEKLPK